MKAVVPTKSDLATMSSIARAGFGYDATKEICSHAGWELTADERDLGFVQYWIKFGVQRANQRLFAVCVREGRDGPFAFVPLYYFGAGGDSAEELPRGPFDRAFRQIAAGLAKNLGPPYSTGDYQYRHRGDGWPYKYSWWRTADASLALVQDEYDIQSGMDVSLWVLPPKAKVKLPVHGNSKRRSTNG